MGFFTCGYFWRTAPGSTQAFFPPWPSEPQVTWCCITSTDRLRFPSCGMEYPFHFENVVPLICSFFISNHQITFSLRRLASACLEDTILVYTGSIKTPLLSQIWPTFPSLITLLIWRVVCTELGRLTGWCSWWGHKLPPVLPHNVKSGFHIPIKTDGMDWTDERSQWERRKRWIGGFIWTGPERKEKTVVGIGRGPQDNVWDVLRKKDGSRWKSCT